MSDRDRITVVVREWVQKAENDLRNAVHTLGMKEDCPTDTVCFYAQQCAEKYIKSFLALKQIPFPKTHDIGELLALMPSSVSIELSVDEQRELTNYATGARYPGWPVISPAEARRAVTIARRVRSAMRKHIPKDILKHGGP